ncbi:MULTISPECIES: TrbC/VirB2 family protein [Selenomonas]|jgi:trbC/VIRB2 family|uniref:TrbC/VirB2 family protein n=1 Tax=Selenomonas TaxID=970 RepID=UPI0001EB2BEC|nr:MULTISPECIES: TrbC/VirB2 family protein [Selenomonas]EFR41037.1 conjugal transfer protein TrbC [Selenomonas sp. oral taxon 137 str. F0430]
MKTICKSIMKYIMVAAVFMQVQVMMHPVFAQSVSSSLKHSGQKGSVSIDFPWMKFFNALVDQLTGPIPMALGAMGIVGAAIALIGGHGGAGTQKFIVIVFAISICLFAPGFVNAIYDSAGGLTIMALGTR